MANEIQVDLRVIITNGNMKYTFQPGTQNIDQTAQGGPTPGFLTIGTSEESEAFSELTALGLCLIQNLDTTNFVEYGEATGVYGKKLMPGDVHLFRLNTGATLYMKADTAACKVLVNAFEA